MKKLFAGAAIVFATLFNHSMSVADATTPPKQPETKRVCIIQKDAKTGKDREVCRQVKIHKKLDGIKVPEKK